MVRPIKLANGSGGYAFDYMLKDHLANVRSVLTDEQQTGRTPVATPEGAGSESAVSKEKSYYEIDENFVLHKPGIADTANVLDYLNDNGSNHPNTFAEKNANNQKMYKLNANTNRTGLIKIMKVMAGDRVNI